MAKFEITNASSIYSSIIHLDFFLFFFFLYDFQF